MPIEIIVGPPFSGKGWFVASEIARREDEGEVGLLSLNYSSIFMAISPGDASSFRDEEVTATARAGWRRTCSAWPRAKRVRARWQAISRSTRHVERSIFWNALVETN